MRSLILTSAADADSRVMEQWQFLLGRPRGFNMPAEKERWVRGGSGGDGELGQEVLCNNVQ